VTAGDHLDGLTAALRRFADERDWGQFHTPKNLVMALAGEVGELIEHFQWLTPEESAEVTADPTRAAGIAEELADVFIYLVRLADVLGVDLGDAARAKLEANAQRYPADRVRGSADKAPPLV
jgi:NTP pyrophosphatase (non-canonical NTP hydrolase)